MPRNTAHRIVVVASSVAIALMAAGCPKKPVDPYEEKEKPRFVDLGKARPVDTTTQPAAAPLLIVQRLEFSAREKLDAAAAILESTLIDPATETPWRINGLRLAALKMSRSDEFTKALPAVNSVGVQQLTMGAEGGRPELYRSAPPLEESRVIRAAVRTDELENVKLPRGQPQWQITAIGSSETDRFRFRLVPHHNFIKPSPMPRPPDEVVYDGLLFERLAASIDLPAGYALVVWWDRPPVLPFPPEPVPSTQPLESVMPRPTTQPYDDPQSPEYLAPKPRQMPALPPGALVYVVPSKAARAAAATQPAEPTGPLRDPVLGDVLMLSQRFGKPSQTMLIFSPLTDARPPRAE